ncbi:MAG: NUDIX hydrolase [Paracoccaceae bacterium]
MSVEQCPGLGTFECVTDYDRGTWARIYAFVRSEPKAFSRDATIGGHVTGSAFVLSPDGTSVLLTHHKKLGIWIQLGGHCDGIKDASFVALKEAYEESGLDQIFLFRPNIFDVDIHVIPKHKSDPAHLHYDVRFLFQASSENVTVSEESNDLAWIPLHDLHLKTSEPTMLRMRDKAVKWIAADQA